MRITPWLALVALLSLAACSSYATKPKPKDARPLAEAAPSTYVRPCAQTAAASTSAFDCDRRSILAMAGEFRVRFAFEETAALAPGYVPHEIQRSGGTELVEVVEDTGERISLQHILVLGPEHVVVKHWRQDWQYQPKQILRFVGNGRFATQTVADTDAHAAWSQTVFEVDDAPRYAGVGRWTHINDTDAWTSDRTLRPLPRREYTKRHDYQALEVINRHTLTPAGWVHEQDNTKLVMNPDGNMQALAREHGLNSYTRIHDYDFSAGRNYWTKTAAFWTQVRDEWTRAAATSAEFITAPEPNGEPRIDAFFKLAERAEHGENIAATEIRPLFDQYVTATESRDLAALRP